MGFAMPAALVALLIALAVAGGCTYSQHQLQKLPRARQPAEGWLEESAAKDQGRLRILSSTEERLDVQIECRPGSDGFLPGKPCSPPLHAHAAPTTEFLTVRQGSMGYTLNGTEAVATADSGSVRIDPELVHTYWNADPETQLVLIATVTPRGDYAHFFKTMAGLGTDYGSYDKVPPLQWVVTYDAVGMRHAAAPRLVWDHVVRRAVVPLAKLAGFRAFEAEY